MQTCIIKAFLYRQTNTNKHIIPQSSICVVTHYRKKCPWKWNKTISDHFFVSFDIRNDTNTVGNRIKTWSMKIECRACQPMEISPRLFISVSVSALWFYLMIILLFYHYPFIGSSRFGHRIYILKDIYFVIWWHT